MDTTRQEYQDHVKNLSQPAFPLVAGDQSNYDDRLVCEGMSKRELAAIELLKAMITQNQLAVVPYQYTIMGEYDNGYNYIKGAIHMADLLFAELEK